MDDISLIDTLEISKVKAEEIKVCLQYNLPVLIRGECF